MTGRQAATAPTFVLQQLDEHGEPRPVFRCQGTVTSFLAGATTYPDRVAAIVAAPGPGWRVVEKARVEREMAGR